MADPENQVQTFAVIICCSLTLNMSEQLLRFFNRSQASFQAKIA